MPTDHATPRVLKRGPVIDAHPLSRRGRKLAAKWNRKGYSVGFRWA